MHYQHKKYLIFKKKNFNFNENLKETGNYGSQKYKSKPINFFYRPVYYRGYLGVHSRLLSYIRCVGKYRSSLLLAKIGFRKNHVRICAPFIPFSIRKLRHAEKFIRKNFLAQHRLKRFTVESIKAKMADPKSLYQILFYQNLPVRGQRTKTNSKTVRSFFKNLVWQVKKRR